MLAWSDKFSTYIDHIDRQHKKLFDLFNRFSDTFAQGNPSQQAVDAALDELLDYAGQHFVDEELLMVQKNVDPRLISMQRMEHKSFFYDIKRLREGLFGEEEVRDKAEKLLRFITLWMTYHILGTDMDMAEQLRLIANGMSPQMAYDSEHAKKRDNVTTRLMLDEVLALWRSATDRCWKLEKELHEIKQNQGIEVEMLPPDYPILQRVEEIKGRRS